MKKLFLIFTGVLLFTGCEVEIEKEKDANLDQIRFEEEYESVNGKELKDDKVYSSIDVISDNKVKYLDSTETIEFLESGTGIIYFGFPECPWCRSLVPVLTEVVSDSNLDELYYFNALDIRDVKKLEDGEIVTSKEGSDDYYKIVEILKDELGSYKGLEDESIKRLYFPTVVFMLDGKVNYVHTGTLDSQTSYDKELSDKQVDELYNKLYDEVVLVDGSVCSSEVETGC